jgi:hypothetical protein
MNSYSAGSLFSGGLLPHISYPTTTGPVRPYIGPYPNYYPNRFYEQQLNAFIESEKARRVAEDARKEDDLMKAQQDEKMTMAHKAREQELMNIILEMQEDARQNAEKWENEKRAIDREANAQAQLKEQGHLPTEPTNTQMAHYKEEVDRLYGIIERFNREKNIEWVSDILYLASCYVRSWMRPIPTMIIGPNLASPLIYLQRYSRCYADCSYLPRCRSGLSMASRDVH